MQIANHITSYADAIFMIAKSKEAKEKYYQQVAALDAMNLTSADFAKVLSTRSIDKNERKELAWQVLKEYGFDEQVIYWVWTIIDNNCFNRFHNIAIMCRERYYDLFGITRVKVTSANELSETQINRIKDFFTQKLKLKIDFEWHIKPDLIGGLRIAINNKTYNNTYRAKLESLKKELLSKKG